MKLILNLLLGAAGVLAASRTSPPSGCVHVAKSGGQYTTVQAAVNSLSKTSGAAQCIFIDQGTYTEQVWQLSLVAVPYTPTLHSSISVACLRNANC